MKITPVVISPGIAHPRKDSFVYCSLQTFVRSASYESKAINLASIPSDTMPKKKHVTANATISIIAQMQNLAAHRMTLTGDLLCSSVFTASIFFGAD